MRIQSVVLSAAIIAALSLNACSPDPKSVSDQMSILKKSKSDKQKVTAVQRLEAIGTEDAYNNMISALTASPKPSSKVTAALAAALGRAKVAAAVPALTEAIDMAAGMGSDQTSIDANNANKEIARALTDIGDPKAAGEIIRLLRASQDNYVRIEAINALSKFKDPAAAEVLIDIVNDVRLEPFLIKKALLALGDLKSESAMDTLIWMLFYEQRGTTFFPESSMGIFKMGDRAVDPVIAILEGTNKELMARAKEEKVKRSAMLAKAAQILGDLGRKKAVRPLIKLLKYEDSDDLVGQYFVRMAAADSLGRIRAQEAIKPLQAMLGDEEADARKTYIRALFMIGDTSTAKKLTGCASKDPWPLRDGCMYGLAMLAPSSDTRLFDGYAKSTPALFKKDCEEYLLFGDIDCAVEGEKHLRIIQKAMSEYRKALETACSAGKLDCLKKNLSDEHPRVRERAAYEMGRRGGLEVVSPLLEAIHRPIEKEEDNAPRFAAVIALDWTVRDSAEAKAAARKDIPQLKKQMEGEMTKVLSKASAEDILRLITKLEQD